MYAAFVGVETPGQDGMRCAPFPISDAALEDFFRVRVWGAPGSTVVPSGRGGSKLRSRRWFADVGIA